MSTLILAIVFAFLFSLLNPCMSKDDELAIDFSPLLKVYKNGTVDRLIGKQRVPPSLDPKTGVQSKDVMILDHAISARFYLPHSAAKSTQKLPLLIYYHGGGFCVDSPFSPTYHNYLNSLVAAANVVAVSVHYRRAPEHHLPIAYKDSWSALKWVTSHFEGSRSEDWLKNHADPLRVFFAGDSAGANIAHHLAVKAGSDGLPGVRLKGIILANPFFWGTHPVGAETKLPPIVNVYMAGLWKFVYPQSSGTDDPLFNPAKDAKLKELGCRKVLVFVAEKDALRDRGIYYSEELKKSGWKGNVQVLESKGQNHVFHLYNTTAPEAVEMLHNIVKFLR